MVLVLMNLQMNSQTTLTKNNRVSYFINQKGDTIITMKLSDAKIIFKDLLDCKILDSLYTLNYEKTIQLNDIMNLRLEEIKMLNGKINNLQDIINISDEKLKNKDLEISILSEDNDKLKKEVRKQKLLKKLFMVTTIALPITLILIL